MLNIPSTFDFDQYARSLAFSRNSFTFSSETFPPMTQFGIMAALQRVTTSRMEVHHVPRNIPPAGFSTQLLIPSWGRFLECRPRSFGTGGLRHTPTERPPPRVCRPNRCGCFRSAKLARDQNTTPAAANAILPNSRRFVVTSFCSESCPLTGLFFLKVLKAPAIAINRPNERADNVKR
jgi:hypothetical protein